jgi:hypothetical protein
MNKIWIAAGGVVALVAISAIAALTGGDNGTPSNTVKSKPSFEEISQ